MLPRRTAARAFLGALAGVVVVHLAAQLVGAGGLADPTQVLLMPLLAGVLWCETSAPRSRLVTLTLLALGLSWLGDSVPRLASGDAAFLLMVGFFLLAGLPIALDWSELEAGPERAATATGFLLLAGNLGGAVLVLAVQVVVGNPFLALGAFAVAVWRDGSWGRSGGVVAQLLVLSIALGTLTGEGADTRLAATIAVPAIVGLVVLIAAARAAGRRARDTPVDEV